MKNLRVWFSSPGIELSCIKTESGPKGIRNLYANDEWALCLYSLARDKNGSALDLLH